MEPANAQVLVENDGTLSCTACGRILEPETIAALFRKEKGGPFDPFCHDCTREMVKAARVMLDVMDAAGLIVN